MPPLVSLSVGFLQLWLTNIGTLGSPFLQGYYKDIVAWKNMMAQFCHCGIFYKLQKQVFVNILISCIFSLSSAML